MIAETTRAIGKREEKRLGRAIRQHEATIRAQPRRAVGCLALSTPLCLLVFLVKPSDPVNQWGMFILFGVFAALNAVVGIVVTVEERRKISNLKEVIRRGSVVEWKVTSDRCFAVVDEDHEQTYYFFDVGEETLVVGDLDASVKEFPNSEFVVSSVLGPDGQLVEEWIKCRGDRLQPIQTFTAERVYEAVEFEHLSRLPGPLDHYVAKAKG